MDPYQYMAPILDPYQDRDPVLDPYQDMDPGLDPYLDMHPVLDPGNSNSTKIMGFSWYILIKKNFKNVLFISSLQKSLIFLTFKPFSF